MSKPLVSVSVITYQHADYIRDCLDGILMQETEFPIELLIHDDASTDGTEEIIRTYEKKYPSIIKPIYEEENQWKKGRRGSAVFNFPRAKGKYIALCEGDDYWIDPLKLQKQVEFMEENDEYGLVFSKAKVFLQEEDTFQEKKIGSPIHQKGILYDKAIPTVTTLFRTNLAIEYIEEYKSPMKKWAMADYPMWIWFYYNSEIHFMNEITAVRRMLKRSASNFEDPKKRMDFLYETFDICLFFAEQYKDQIDYLDLVSYKCVSLYHSAIINDVTDTRSTFHKIKHYDIKRAHNIYLFCLEKLKFKYVIFLGYLILKTIRG